MRIESVALETLTVDPANVRRHPQRNLEAIRASLRKFGQQKPIVVNSDGVVIAGNGTLEAARAEGWGRIDVVRSDLAGVEVVAYSIADNRTAELAEWHEADLAAVLAELQKDESLDELVTGFDATEIGEFVTRTTAPTDGDWAAHFEASGDTSTSDSTEQITFVLAREDVAALREHLQRYDANKNVAIVKWLRDSS